MTTRFLIYGANGYVGEAAARLAVAQGLQPILAGRNRASIEPLAKALGVEFRACALDDAAALDRALERRSGRPALRRAVQVHFEADGRCVSAHRSALSRPDRRDPGVRGPGGARRRGQGAPRHAAAGGRLRRRAHRLPGGAPAAPAALGDPAGARIPERRPRRSASRDPAHDDRVAAVRRPDPARRPTGGARARREAAPHRLRPGAGRGRPLHLGRRLHGASQHRNPRHRGLRGAAARHAPADGDGPGAAPPVQFRAGAGPDAARRAAGAERRGAGKNRDACLGSGQRCGRTHRGVPRARSGSRPGLDHAHRPRRREARAGGRGRAGLPDARPRRSGRTSSSRARA